MKFIKACVSVLVTITMPAWIIPAIFIAPLLDGIEATHKALWGKR